MPDYAMIAVCGLLYLGAGLLAARACYARWRPSSVPLCGKGDGEPHARFSSDVCVCGGLRTSHWPLGYGAHCGLFRPAKVPGHCDACYRRPHTMSVPLARSQSSCWPLTCCRRQRDGHS